LAAQLSSEPVYTPTPRETITVVEQNYLEKPIIVATEVTPVPLKIQSKFPYGYCTYYVSTKVSVPWIGNASQWLHNAPEYNYEVTNEPSVGDIVVTSEGDSRGHVAYVESVSDNTITVSEMNYKGWGIVSTRKITKKSSFIRGFIKTDPSA
jgi:surface antigen